MADLGGKAPGMMVATAPYEATDPTVDSQIATLQSSGADLLYDVTGANFAVQAIRNVAKIGRNPVHTGTLRAPAFGCQ